LGGIGLARRTLRSWREPSINQYISMAKLGVPLLAKAVTVFLAVTWYSDAHGCGVMTVTFDVT